MEFCVGGAVVTGCSAVASGCGSAGCVGCIVFSVGVLSAASLPAEEEIGSSCRGKVLSAIPARSLAEDASGVLDCAVQAESSRIPTENTRTRIFFMKTTSFPGYYTRKLKSAQCYLFFRQVQQVFEGVRCGEGERRSAAPTHPHLIGQTCPLAAKSTVPYPAAACDTAPMPG